MKRMRMKPTRQQTHTNRMPKTRYTRPGNPKGFPGSLIPTFVIVCIAIILCIGFLSLFKIFNPYYTISPFATDITIGEAVIGPWNYGGTDPVGNLRFYHAKNGFQTVVLPPQSGKFAAEGTYVVLLNHSPVSLEFETRTQYIIQLLTEAGTFFSLLLILPFALITGLRKSAKRKSAFRLRSRKR
ncbi:hypothetical protein LSG31_11230 [Fodinisporobacter ferrooxydans]|uniref:DUF3592 domain-containing protein n=1 Tax=Fodinisporobacter ferrooxydans TaxID=2901836 RepID=A0ABY4CQS8_9BACL|nr:hypothetical protein LSG31_11230 [Alicyclobacillaceae bacterium MYW30-H2]